MVGSTNVIRRKDIPSTSTNGAKPKAIHDQQDQLKSVPSHSNIDPDHLTLWYHPITTLNYFIRELFEDCKSFAKKTLQYKKTVLCTVIFISLFLILGRVSGPQQLVRKWNKIQLQLLKLVSFF